MRRALAGAALLFWLGTAAALPRQALVPGGIAVLPLGAASGATAPRVRFRDAPQAVVREDGRWYALVGLPLDLAPGPQTASVETDGATRLLAFAVAAKDYPQQRLHIPDTRMVTPPPELEARIDAEQERLAAIKRRFSAAQPETRLDLPAHGRLSSRFGLRRILNGEPRAPHAGLDLAVGVGTPLRAPAPGTVVLAEDLYFTGKTVVIDHGNGLLTLYAHLSRLDVGVGQALARGDGLGLSGVSGRITGPHLHWAVILGGTPVDPELFLAAAGPQRR